MHYNIRLKERGAPTATSYRWTSLEFQKRTGSKFKNLWKVTDHVKRNLWNIPQVYKRTTARSRLGKTLARTSTDLCPTNLPPDRTRHNWLALIATYRRRCCRPWRGRCTSWGSRGWRSCPPYRCPIEWAHCTSTTCSPIPPRCSTRPMAPLTHSLPRPRTCSSDRLPMCPGRFPPEPSPWPKPWTKRPSTLRWAW